MEHSYRLVNLQMHANGKRQSARWFAAGRRASHQRKLARIVGTESKSQLRAQADRAILAGKGKRIT